MIDLLNPPTLESLQPKIKRFWELSAEKIRAVESSFDPAHGAPVFTAEGRYVSRGWTEWTQGFQFGSALLQFDATDDGSFLELGRRKTLENMAVHVTHTGVHDHAFNNVSTYGNLLRLAAEGRIDADTWERRYYELALKCSGAVQAARWTEIDGGGYIYSFNGPHSLFADTIRTLRSLAVAHQLGHVLHAEGDRRISMLDRLVAHAEATAQYSVYYGEQRDAYDVPGRVAHESIFNVIDGSYRCPSTQQGYSPFSTWTRGLAWIILGFAEQLEFVESLPESELEDVGGKNPVRSMMQRAAMAAADFYLEWTPGCGVPYWDTGAPGLSRIENYLDRPADPFNGFEPVDSSAAAIASQGLLRLGHFLDEGERYWDAGLRTLDTLLSPPYLSEEADHQGLILHSVYHRPRGWDYGLADPFSRPRPSRPDAGLTHPPDSSERVPAGAPHGESTMWGDYHAREAVLYLQRATGTGPYLTFFNIPPR